MDQDRIKGSVKKGAGKAEEAWGDATNDPKAQDEGRGRQVEGKVQERWGEAKDAIRDAVGDATRDAEDELDDDA